MGKTTRIILTAALVLWTAAGTALGQSYTLGPSGGGGGEAFADSVPERTRVAEVRIWAGSRVDAIQLVHEGDDGSVELDKHGGGGGTLHTFELRADEYIAAISGRYSKGVSEIRFHTNKNRTSPPYGKGGGVDFRYEAPAGTEIAGFNGRAGGALDAIGVILRQH